MGRAHEKLERQVLRALGCHPELVLYRNEVGQGYVGAVRPLIERALVRHGAAPELHKDVIDVLNRHRISWGLGVGSPDLVGALSGQALGFEIKPEGDRVRPEQRRWHAAARRGGWHIEIIRSVEEAHAALERARL